MSTATEQIMERDTKRADERRLEAELKAFHERWAPHNHDYDSQWHAEFYMLVRLIYQDAQAPFAKALHDALMSAPMPPIFVNSDKKSS